jgi:hypothetical protein
MWWYSWLRHCATSRNVVGSILYVAIDTFHRLTPPGFTMAVESMQSLTEMITRDISWG